MRCAREAPSADRTANSRARAFWVGPGHGVDEEAAHEDASGHFAPLRIGASAGGPAGAWRWTSYFFRQWSSPIFCQAPLFSTSVSTVNSFGLFRVTVVRLFIG